MVLLLLLFFRLSKVELLEVEVAEAQVIDDVAALVLTTFVELPLLLLFLKCIMILLLPPFDDDEVLDGIDVELRFNINLLPPFVNGVDDDDVTEPPFVLVLLL